jgi:SAM-dependent methyltransferase
VANPRHEQLKFQINDVLRGRRNLRILDVGCGAGVMTAHLRRYGDVIGIDFSRAAIETARGLAPGVRFIAGTLDEVPRDESYDLITLFDVLEHIPRAERPEFLGVLRGRLAQGGILFLSTPFPAFTHYRRINGDDTLQVVDEEVELPQLAAECAGVGLQLVRYEAYDVFRGSPEYQVAVFTTARAPGGAPELRSERLERRVHFLRSRAGRRIRRAEAALRLALSGRLREAHWMLAAQPPDVRS